MEQCKQEKYWMIFLSFYLPLITYAYRKNFKISYFFRLICIDCGHDENCDFLLGDVFNIKGDLILSEVEQINLSYKSCQNCENFIYIDLKKLFTVSQIRRIWYGICAGKKKQDKN